MNTSVSFWTMVRQRCVTTVRHVRAAYLAVCFVCGTITLLRPTGIDGNALSYTPGDACGETVSTAASVVLAVAALLPLRLVGYDADHHFDAVTFLGGTRVRTTTRRDLVCCLLLSLTSVLTMAAVGGMLSLAEHAGRHLLGQPVGRLDAPTSLGSGLKVACACLLVTSTVWALVVVTNSARRAVLTTLGLLLSLLFPLLFVATGQRSWIGIHPLAWVITLSTRRSSVLSFDSPTWLLTTSGLIGAAALWALALHRLSRR